VRHLTLAEVLELHARISREAGRPAAVRDIAALGAAVAEPRRTLARKEVHSTLDEKGAALAAAIAATRPFGKGDLAAAHAALEAFLLLNGRDLKARFEEAEEQLRGLAAGTRSREGFMAWIRERMAPAGGGRG
jgi:death-on-curing protein